MPKRLSDGTWLNLISGRPEPEWMPRGGMTRVLEIKARDRLSWAQMAERFGTTVNALKGARYRHLVQTKNGLHREPPSA